MVAFDDWMRMDLEYIERQSMMFDLALLARTPWAVISGRGAV
jgi:lipopolysaccharide/colanic/teichoic acid biosynthesis glycosyltransferase